MVKNRLPEPGQTVIGVDMLDSRPVADLIVYCGKDQYGEGNEWASYRCNTFDPTYWHPLPELPTIDCEKNGHEWIHIPLGDGRECRWCGEAQ